MGNTKNHNRRNKNKQTKKYKRVGGDFMEEEAKKIFKDIAGSDEKIDPGEYQKVKDTLEGAAKISFKDAAQGDDKIEFHEFLALYYFLKASGSDAEIDNEDEYANLQGLLPDKFDGVSFATVAGPDNKIQFDEFLTVYNKPKTGGRRRRKRSTRNKRKSNKKRRTVKRRKSAKRSHRRK